MFYDALESIQGIIMFHRFRKDKKQNQSPSSPKPSPKPSKTPTFSQESVHTVTPYRRDTASSDSSLRLITGKTNLSTFDPLFQSTPNNDVETRPRGRSKDRRADPMGLQVIYAPDNPPTIDIIFVHGLGGTSQQTWSRNRDPELFWPKEWLPYEPDICTARILSFGYNAHFSAVGVNNSFNISDFAKELLFGMKFGMDKESKLLDVGKVPIIFVAHSMGGLVVKKAYILGQNDMHYTEIVHAMVSIIFLSTPHRGTNLADVLNRILTASVFNHSPKQYIAELRNNSPTLQEINEQFRHVSSTLQIVSFFETMPTVIGPKKMMVLEKDSSVLGYPGEISLPLTADHHDVCKYFNQQDPNYISVRNVLSSIVSRFKKKAELAVSEPQGSLQEDLAKVARLVGINEAPDEDCQFFSERWMPGSCQWLLENTIFKDWIESTLWEPRLVWLRGLPGTGKSVISSFVIGHLRKLELDCQFFFFRFGDQRKTSLNIFLRSIAFQIAQQVPTYRQKLSKLADEVFSVEKAESRIVWQRLFASIFLMMDLQRPIYWVIDALDECDSPTTLLNLFTAISSVGFPLRIMFVSRKNPSLSMSFDRLAVSTSLQIIEVQDADKDLKLYIAREIEYMRGSSDIKAHVATTVLEKAGGNFLWVHLVLEEIMQCHTEADIEQALNDLPADLEPLYARMESALSKSSRPADQELAMTILNWASCAKRALTLAELSQALFPEDKPVLDLQHTINQACGEFVIVDVNSNVNMLHQTARDYLIRTPGLRFSISPPEAHYMMLKTCITYLMEKGHRTRVGRPCIQPFFMYATTSWPYHLYHSSAYKDQSMLILLSKFLQRPSVLTWINALAQVNQLRVLVQASKRLGIFLEKRGRIDSEKSPTTHCLREKEIIEKWATDLVKIVGKFGGNLINQPNTIFKMIPSFCPPQSIIYRQFGPKNTSSGLRITGFSNESWDDSLAKFSLGRDCQPLEIVCLERFFAVRLAEGIVILWNTETCEEIRRFAHGESILAFKFSHNGEKLATSSFYTTKIWHVASGVMEEAALNPDDFRVQDLAFTADDTMLIACGEDRIVRQLPVVSPSSGWDEVSVDSDLHGPCGAPSCLAFNADGTQLAIAYRSYPLSVWSIDYAGFVGTCERPDSDTKSSLGVSRVCWNHDTGHVVGIYNDGVVFKWHPICGELESLKTVALEVQCSPDGNLIVVSDADGTLQIWSFHHLALVYQLKCNANVVDLAIDPLGHRIYDLRETYCNIWEPNALIRLAEVEEKNSDASSTIANSAHLSLSEVSIEMLEPVTALAISPVTSTYCAGNDEGILTLSKKPRGEVVELSHTYMTIDHIGWSADERTLVTGDLSGRVNVTFVDLSIPKVENSPLFSITIKDRVRQLLLHPRSTHLLISTYQTTSIYSLETQQCIATLPSPNDCPRWCVHPTCPTHLVSYSYTDINIYTWTPFKRVLGVPICRQTPSSTHSTPVSRIPTAVMSPRQSSEEIDRTYVNIDNSLTLVQASKVFDDRRRKKEFMLIKTAELVLDEPDTLDSSDVIAEVSGMPLPPDIAAKMEMPLGFLGIEVGRKTMSSFGGHSVPSHPRGNSSGTTLAFLDKEFWVCTGTVATDGTGTGNVKRHHFLPRDWLNMECLELTVISRDGTLFIPRNGEVAVIKGGFGEEWTG